MSRVDDPIQGILFSAKEFISFGRMKKIKVKGRPARS